VHANLATVLVLTSAVSDGDYNAEPSMA